MTTKLSREFQLVAACCVWPPQSVHDVTVFGLAAGPLDWPQVPAIAGRQRVMGLVHASLARAGVKPPPNIAQSLAERAREIAKRGLAQAIETGRLQRALDDAGIGNLVLKGAAVEMLAYGQLGQKEAWDIDLLVSPADVNSACLVLADAGYELTQPKNLSPAQFSTFVELARECEFFSYQNGMHVELHWGLADGPALLKGMSIASPVQLVAVSEAIRLRTFAREELFAYLCVHGAMHGWSRLKWLADLAALLGPETPESIGRLYRRSRELGAGLCSAQALLLCQHVLGAELGPVLRKDLSGVLGASWLVGVALKTMAGGGERELEARPFATARVLISQTALGGSWRHAKAQIGYRAVSVHDRVHMPLPNRLRFLYPILRAPFWLWRRLVGTTRRQ